MVDLFSEMRSDIRDNLLRQIIARIEHRQNNPLDIELRIDRPSYLADRIEQLAKAFQRKKTRIAVAPARNARPSSRSSSEG